MRHKLCLLGILGLLAAAAPVRVDDAYTIKVKKSGKGDVSLHEKVDVEDSSFKIEDADGKKLQDKQAVKTTTETYVETILEKEKGKKATKLRREYTKAAIKTDGNERTLPYQGKTVLIEKKNDGKYHFRIEGGEEVTGKDAESLSRSFNKENADDGDENDLEKVVLPTHPVKVNGTWDVDAAALVKALLKDSKQPFPVDKSKVKGTGKLLKAYKKGERQFGQFEIEVTLPLKGDFPIGKDQGAPIKEGSKMVMHVKADGCIDGSSSDAKGEVSLDIDITATIKGPDGKDYKMVLHAKQTGNETEKEQMKK